MGICTVSHQWLVYSGPSRLDDLRYPSWRHTLENKLSKGDYAWVNLWVKVLSLLLTSWHMISAYFFFSCLLPALFDLSLPKKKLKDERKKKKMRTIKMESEDPCESLAPSDSLSVPPANIINSLPDTPSTPLPNIKEEWVYCCIVGTNNCMCCPCVTPGPVVIAELWRRLRAARS